MITLRKKEDCSFDMIALGEIMLRLDPGDMRVRNARNFRVWEGGGEYNVARGLRRCFGLKTSVVTAFADNDVGRLLEDFILQGGVDTSLIRWVPYDGIGRKVRNGLNFTERGYGVRGALGISDRAYTAVSQLKPGDIDWEEIFGRRGARCGEKTGVRCRRRFLGKMQKARENFCEFPLIAAVLRLPTGKCFGVGIGKGIGKIMEQDTEAVGVMAGANTHRKSFFQVFFDG